jgi:hypothetical protein
MQDGGEEANSPVGSGSHLGRCPAALLRPGEAVAQTQAVRDAPIAVLDGSGEKRQAPVS